MTAAGRWCALAVLGVLAACGGGGGGDESNSDDPVPEAAVQALEGIYQVSSFTRNEAACVEGASVLSTLRDHYVVIFSDVVLGIRTLQVVSCFDEATCRMLVQQARTQGFYSYEYSLRLSASQSDGVLTGFQANTGSGSSEKPGLCTDRTYVEHRLTSEAEGAVHVESRTTALDDVPQDDGACWAEPKKQKAEAAGKTCTGLEVFDATRIAAL